MFRRYLETLEQRVLLADALQHFGPPPGPIYGTGEGVSSGGAVTWVLLNADNGEAIGTVSQGASINLAQLPTRRLNVRAEVAGDEVAGVRFGYNGQAAFRTDSEGAFTLMDDAAQWTPAAGPHALVATPLRPGGAAGQPTAINFSFTTGDTYLPVESPRIVTDLNPGWSFHKGDVSGAQLPAFDDSSWETVSLPHSYNAQDGQDGGHDFYRGPGWYRKDIDIPGSFNGSQTYVRFDGAFLTTDVYVNGTLVGTHEGGFSAFTFDLTPHLQPGQINTLAVKVDNTPNMSIAPLAGNEILLGGADFTFHGGLYRGVELITTPTAHVTLTDFSSPGVYVKQTNVSNASANVEVVTKLRNDAAVPRTLTVVTDIVNADGVHVANLTGQQVVNPNSTFDFSQATVISNPRLWNGKADPHLYDVYVHVLEGETLLDLVQQPLGLRYFHIDPNEGFFLNGQYLDLHGVNLHQDRIDKGWAVSSEDLEQDVALMDEMGVNFVRMSHYQHHEETYDLLDQKGIMVWSEIPYIYDSTDSPEFKANIEQQLVEMIRQKQNHPSVVLWGLFNGLELDPVTQEMVPRLHQVAKAEDPSRLTTAATVSRVQQNSPLNFYTDVIAYNDYFGWYRGRFEDFGTFADGFHRSFPDKPFGVAEYGAGGSVFQHGENITSFEPTDGIFHSEEYQSLYHEEQWRQMKDRKYLWSKNIFAMFDFAVDERDEGDTAGRNDKGMVTYDRTTRKDAFYFYKSNWTDTPTLRLAASRYNQRPLRDVNVKAYSNLDSVELFVNGESKGSLAGDAINTFRWDSIRLAGGENLIEVVGTKDGQTYRDSATWTAPQNDPPVNGLIGMYSDNKRLRDAQLIRYEPSAALDWGMESPGGSIGSDGWSARFTGRILADFSETYTFRVLADDGVRLFVDGKLIVDDWNNGASGEKSGTVALDAAVRHTIVIEFFDNTGGASLSLDWSSPSLPRQAVPADHLFTS